MDTSSSSVLIVILLALDAMITQAYAALRNTKPHELEEAAQQQDAGAIRILQLTQEESYLTITYNLVLLVLRFGMMALLLTGIIIPALDAGTMTPIGALALVGLTVAIILIIGDLSAEGVGSAYAESISRATALPFQILITLLKPITFVLFKLSSILASIFGSQLVNIVTEEEILTLVNAGHTIGTIEEDEKDMIASVLRLDETLAREIMTPRVDIEAVEKDAPVQDALTVFMESGFSRIPVYEENIDTIVGILYAKDVLGLLSNGQTETNKQKPVHEFMRNANVIPEDIPADELLQQLRGQNIHIAIVVDEYGGTSGLITIENLVEEIVGDIRDEYDLNEQVDYVINGKGEYIIDAGMDLDDMNELLELNIEPGDVDTLGGLIYTHLGRTPRVNEMIDTDDVQMKVLSMERRRIRKVRVMPKTTQPTEPSAPIVESS